MQYSSTQEELSEAQRRGFEDGYGLGAGCQNPYPMEAPQLRQQWRVGFGEGVMNRGRSREQVLTPFQRRHIDTMKLLDGMYPWSGEYSQERISHMEHLGLLESVPKGAPTEGGGVLITATRLRFELDRAYEAGKEGA